MVANVIKGFTKSATIGTIHEAKKVLQNEILRQRNLRIYEPAFRFVQHVVQ